MHATRDYLVTNSMVYTSVAIGVVALALPVVPEVPRGPFLDRIPVRSSRQFVRLAIQRHSGPLPPAS